MDEQKFFKAEWNQISDRRAFLRSLIMAYDSIGFKGMEPGAEIWSTNRPYFINHAKPRILEFWSEETSLPPEQFPWTDEFCVYSWISWRKAVGHIKSETKQKLGLEDLFANLEPGN